MPLKIKLKFLEQKDTTKLRDVFNEKLFKEYEMGGYPFKISDAIKYIKKSIELKLKKQSFVFGVFKRNSLIGVVSLYNINWVHKYAELFYWIRKDVRNKGYGSEAIKRLLKLAFDKYKLNRVEAKLRIDNVASKRLLEKLNFKLEGKLRKKFFNNGVFNDALEYALLKSDFNK